MTSENQIEEIKTDIAEIVEVAKTENIEVQVEIESLKNKVSELETEIEFIKTEKEIETVEAAKTETDILEIIDNEKIRVLEKEAKRKALAEKARND